MYIQFQVLVQKWILKLEIPEQIGTHQTDYTKVSDFCADKRDQIHP